MQKDTKGLVLMIVAVLGLVVAPAFAQDTVEAQSDMSPVMAEAGTDTYEKPIPVTFYVDYTLVSDYIFRGINFSEYSGEGREKPNHQVNLAAEVDLEEYGSVGVAFFFEWFAGQERLTGGEANLQEVDYSAYWSYDLEDYYTNIELGYILYQFPRLDGDDEYTQEWYVTLSMDDSVLWGTDEPVLNPYISLYDDFDDFQGYWIETGISHDFAMADVMSLVNMEDTPILKDVVLTPSLVLGIDHRWMANAAGTGSTSTKLANLTYGLDASYDLGSALDMPAEWGSIGLNGFVYFSQALGRDDIISDEFYGGMTVSYEW